MSVLSVIDKIYENSNFTHWFIGAVIALILLFFIVFLIGLRDAKKSKLPKKIVEEDVKEVTFKKTNKPDVIKEDVTFEMPVLTKNLQDFKKNLEEELASEKKIAVKKTSGLKPVEAEKPTKILDMDAIEDTDIIPVKAIQKAAAEIEEEEEIETKKDSNKVKLELEKEDDVYNLDDDF